jgi:plastocyanin
MALHNRVFKVVVALSVGAALAGVTACSSQTSTAAAGNRSSMSPMPNMSTADSGAAGVGAPVATDTVAIDNFAFAPATITVPEGTTVTWTNKDGDAHTVAAQDGSFSSAPLATGAGYRHTFTKPGTYSYLCTIHPFMTATVVVTP